MFLSKLVAYYSLLITLSQAELECTLKTPGFCGGGIEKELQQEALDDLMDLKAKLDEGEIHYINFMKHDEQKIPETFDARKKWPMCRSIRQIKHQGVCGTSWAFATAMVTTDRACISSRGRKSFNVSEQDLILCCHLCYEEFYDESRCDVGGNLISPLIYMMNYGVAEGKCKAYDTDKFKVKCLASCDHKKVPYTRVRILKISVSSGENFKIKDIQLEIMKNGPVAAYLNKIPPEFQLKYKNEVYIHSKKEEKNGPPHAIRVIGWGTEGNVPYWLCANTWGNKWGIKGSFKIRRGTNELGIEEFFIAADLKLGSLKLTHGIKSKKTIFDPLGHANHSGTRSTRALQFYKIIVIVLIICIL